MYKRKNSATKVVETEADAISKQQHSFHADRFGSALFASLWVEAWGEQYPIEVAPFSSCTHRLLQQFDQLLELSPDEVLVDLGCGTGGVGLWLAQKQRARLIGIDRCNDATAIAIKRAPEWELATPASFVTGEFCQNGLASFSADAAISIDALPASQDIECALSEVRRILRPKGSLLFTTRELSESSRHYESLGPCWRAGLEKSGFKVTTIIERPEVSGLWRSLYHQWLEHETELRGELQPETVDAMVAEAHRVTPTLNDGRPWYLIKATLSG